MQAHRQVLGAPMPSGKCLVGTSGWSYADWARGRFYSRGLQQRDWLGLYAQHFTR